MAAEKKEVVVIGRCSCPVCGSVKASLRLSAKQLSYIHCNACHFQGFARSDHSDGKLRAMLIAEPAAAVDAAPPAAVPVPKRAGWGFGVAAA